MSNLRTNYKDDVFSGSRKYRTVNNADGTVSFTDETTYTQRGDTYGAAQINQSNEIINSLDNNAYKSTDAAMTDIADNDYIPVYDTSASTRKKALWSTLKSLFSQAFAIKVHDSNSANTYGAGSATKFGHVKLSNVYSSVEGGADSSLGASQMALYLAYSDINSSLGSMNAAIVGRFNSVEDELTANNNRIYMDYKNGKYGYNTSASRGADTFHPFKSDITFNVIEPSGSVSSITIQNALQYTKIIVVGSEGSAWYEKTGGLVLTVNGGTIDEVRPSGGPYNKNSTSAIITPTSDTLSINLSTYEPEEGLTYPHLTAYCIKN